MLNVQKIQLQISIYIDFGNACFMLAPAIEYRILQFSAVTGHISVPVADDT